VAEVPSHEVGLSILRPLRELDEVAYLRFASVYRAFDSLEDFEKEIGELRSRHLPGGTPPLPGMQPDLPPPRRRGGRTQPGTAAGA
jgi:transcriptional repressor NrdR